MDLARLLTTVRGLLVGITTLQSRGLIDLRDPRAIVRLLGHARVLSPVAAALAGSVDRDGDALAVIDDRGRHTFAELDADARALAAAWAADGFGPDSTIAVLCRDSREFVTIMAATGHLGATMLLANTGFAPPQLAEVLAREGVDLLVLDDEFTEVAAAVPSSLPRRVAWTEDERAEPGTFVDDLARGRALPALPPPSRSGNFVLLTSGTTGTPKGAPRKVRSTTMTMQLLDRVPLETGCRTLVLSPMFHATGLSMGTLTLAVGGTLVLRRRFDAEGALATIAEERLTGVVAVPTQLRRMLDVDPDVLAAADTTSLTMLLTAGSALPAALSERAMARFGPVLHNLYGSTEVAIATVATPDQLATSPGTVGTPPTGCRVRLYDEDDREVTARGVTARIFVDNGTEFEGYTDGRTKQVIDGFMASGDVGHLDEHGLWHVDGRDDDMIVSGGENVFPAEVEELLAAHDAIAEACVIGVDDEDFGQRLAAYVVPAPGATVDAELVKTCVKENLARHKVPRDVVVLDDLPRNPTGKVLVRELPAPR